MKISDLMIHKSNGLEVVRHLFNPNLEWDVEFDLSIIRPLIRLDGDTYTDPTGREHKLPENAAIIAESLKPFLEVAGENNVLTWQQFMRKTEQRPGFAKWMCLSYLCQAGFACNSTPLLNFLESLDGAETAALSTLLHCPEYLTEDPYSNIVSKAERSLVDKLCDFSTDTCQENDAYLEASSHYAFIFHDTDIMIPTVVKSETLGLGLRIINARHASELLELIISSFSKTSDIFSDSFERLKSATHSISKIRKPSRFHATSGNFSDLEREFMAIYDGNDKEHDLNYFVEKYGVIISNLTTAECHILRMMNSFIAAFEPRLLRDCTPINTFHLYDYQKVVTQADIDEYINHWSDEIIESTAFRRVFPAHSPSFYAHKLFRALELRSDSNFAFYSRTDETTYSKLKNYAVLRCTLLSHSHLMKQNLDHLANHEQFSEHYLDESFDKFISLSGLMRKEDLDIGMLRESFQLLPLAEQSLDNKLFCGIPLTQAEFEAANPRQKRHHISQEFGL